ncbi:TetR/AcrR family transcriptional regulator [Rubrolithibacter danxiaensis]|uniref:TetR/AcrR family transcriptional regulator n=1 Tax=Rubrolithibacter danxiaensis TaxID=3390805 RepID=UPI003BF79C32
MDKTVKDQSTEEKILQAAKKVFVLKGMAGARMQDIANEAGINKALLHYYFRSKEKLFEVIFTEALMRIVPRVTAILDSDEPLFDKIEEFCSDYIDVVSDNPYIPLFVINEMNKQPDDFIKKIWGKQKPAINNFLKQVEEYSMKGLIKETDPHQLLTHIISMTIFPFLAKPILFFITDMDNKHYLEFMQKRKKEIPQFIINSIKK